MPSTKTPRSVCKLSTEIHLLAIFPPACYGSKQPRMTSWALWMKSAGERLVSWAEQSRGPCKLRPNLTPFAGISGGKWGPGGAQPHQGNAAFGQEWTAGGYRYKWGMCFITAGNTHLVNDGPSFSSLPSLGEWRVETPEPEWNSSGSVLMGWSIYPPALSWTVTASKWWCSLSIRLWIIPLSFPSSLS